MKRVRVERLPASTGCPLHGADGPCPAECRMGDRIAPAPTPPGYVLRGGQWIPVAARPCGHEDGADDPAVTERGHD